MTLQESKKKLLVIQTAFIGDTILASHFVGMLKKEFLDHEIHFLLRKGNEGVMEGVPGIAKIWVWDKSHHRYLSLLQVAWNLRKIEYCFVFNLHRHASSGVLTVLAKAKKKIGFRSNPLSFLFDVKVEHQIPHKENGVIWHETQRNLQLLRAVKPHVTIPDDPKLCKPQLGTLESEWESVYKKVFLGTSLGEEYIVIAPASVWFTKAWGEEKFRELATVLRESVLVFLVGGAQDAPLCARIAGQEKNVVNLAGKLSLRETAALMKKAKRVFVNDSSPLHLASAVNAPTTAIFCSTVPDFGYFPLADDSVVLGDTALSCRPCGLHGHPRCPLGHFQCSKSIPVDRAAKTLEKA